MHKKFSKIIYPLLALMLALSINSVVFAQTGDQQGGDQQDQAQEDEQNQDDDNQQNQQDVGAQQGGDQQGDQQQGTPQIDAQQGQQGTQQQQQGQQFEAQQGAQQGTQQNQVGQQGMMASGACAQTYVVQQGDTLGDIANRFLGSIDAYQQIVQATNAAASGQQGAFQQTDQQQGQQGTMQQGQPSATQQGQQDQQGATQQNNQQDQQGMQQGQPGATQQQGQQGTMQQGQPSATQQGQQGMQNQQQGQFTPIDDPNVIQVGQVLCIPGQNGQLAQGQSTFQQGDPSTFQPTPGQEGFGGDLFDVPEDMAKVIIENLSSRDLIVDVSMGPQPQSQWVGPGEQHTFVIQPGAYNLTGHEPGGEFAIVPGQLDLVPGTVIGIACQEDGRCQSHSMQDLMAMQQQGVGTMGQQQQQGTMQQGQQQGTMQQGQQQGTMQQGTQQQQGDQQGTMQQGQQQGTQQQQDDGTEGIPQQDPQDNDAEDSEGTGG